MVIRVKTFQTESMVGTYSKSLARAIGKVLLMKSSWNTIETRKGDEKCSLFVNKQLFWWSASITLDITMMF